MTTHSKGKRQKAYGAERKRMTKTTYADLLKGATIESYNGRSDVKVDHLVRDMGKTIDQVRTFVGNINPAQALLLLQNSVKSMNRPVSKAHIARLVQTIRSNEWVVNGETIVLDEKGKLLDGQHRLTSCILAGMPILTVIVAGVPASTWDSIDQGSKRTGGHVLAAMGYQETSLRAAVLGRLGQFAMGWPAASRRFMSNQAMLMLNENMPGDIYDSVRFCRRLRPPGMNMGPQSNFVTLHYLLSEFSEDGKEEGRAMADEFIGGLLGGMGLGDMATDVRARLRNRLIAPIVPKRGKADREPKTHMGLMVKALNAYVTDTPIERLQFATGKGEKVQDPMGVDLARLAEIIKASVPAYALEAQ